MFESFKKIWNTHGFEIILVGCLIFICIFALTRIGKTGTWSASYSYNPVVHPTYNGQKPRQGPPKNSKGEIECRRVLQKLFKRPFNNCRPDFLLNPVTGGHFNLELDCYDESLKLAVEFSGKQHYFYNSYMHKNKEAFYNQKYRDDMKSRICKENGITLIVVSYKVKNGDIEQYLIRELINKGYKPYFTI